MIIRTAHTDAIEIGKIHGFGLTIPELNVSFTGDFMTPSELRSVIESPNAVTYLAEHKGEIVGLCLARLDDPDRRSDAQACLVYIAVSEPFRGKGVATKLYETTVSTLRIRGVEYLYTWACPTSGAVEFFKKHGLITGRSCTWMDAKL